MQANRVVYLHGFASSPSSSKARHLGALLAAAGLNVTIPDLAAGDFPHLTLSGQLDVLGRHAAGEPVTVVGSSMGGYLAALYAARHPEVTRTVLLAPAFDFGRRWAERLGPARMDEWRRSGSMNVFHYGENRDVALSYRLMEDAAQYEPWPDFHQPGLIFHGSRDEVVPAALSQQFAAMHPNVRLELLDSGHELLNVLDYMGGRILEFLGAAA